MTHQPPTLSWWILQGKGRERHVWFGINFIENFCQSTQNNEYYTNALRAGMAGNSKDSAWEKSWSLIRVALAYNHKRHWRHALWHHWQLGSGTTLQPRRIWLGTHLTRLHIGLLEDPSTKQATSCFHSWQLLTEELVSNLDTCRLLENRNETPRGYLLGIGSLVFHTFTFGACFAITTS